MPIMRQDINSDGNQKFNFWESPKTRKKWVQILKCACFSKLWEFYFSKNIEPRSLHIQFEKGLNLPLCKLKISLRVVSKNSKVGAALETKKYVHNMAVWAIRASNGYSLAYRSNWHIEMDGVNWLNVVPIRWRLSK